MLFLMRHGPAEGTPASGRDEDRALTPSGTGVVRAVVERLLARSERPIRIVSSPFVRARETAALVAERLGLEVELDSDLGAERDPSEIIERLFRSEPAVMVVGHDPYFSQIVSAYAKDHVIMEKAMIVAFEAGPSGAPRERFRIRP